MPVEQQDNTRVVKPLLLKPIGKVTTQPVPLPEPDQLWDTDKVKIYQNMQNFYNNNFWGYGVFGRQTNYNPRTSQGQAAIQSNFDYAKQNAENFVEQLAVAGIGEGVGQAIRWATTPVETGRGAEAIVSSAPASTRVTKVTTIPRSEMHLRNQVPGALRSDYVRTSNGLTTYTQNKVRILSADQIKKATKSLENIMKSKGWHRITHPNLDGLGFTNGRYVVSDLGVGNIGQDLLGRPRLVDFVIETVPDFRIAMQKQGGTFKNIT